jgi:hypothetical protein|tara:strand:- start:488 stop:742 length:255 start_codon:yes stop_codon:yes gene_type:complete
MPNLAYKQPALQRNKPMDYAKPAGSKMKKKTTTKKKKEQGYKDRKDESIAMRVKKKRTKKQLKASRDESYGKFGGGKGKGKINK